MKRIVGSGSSTLSYEDQAYSVLSEESCPPLKLPHRLSMYDHFPDHEIRLEVLEKLAVRRVKLLKAMENFTARQQHHGQADPNSFLPFEDRLMPLHSNLSHKGYPLDEERLNDIVSHFILREDSRRWLVAQESALFRWRFNTLLQNVEERTKFIDIHFPQLKFVPEGEVLSLHPSLRAVSGRDLSSSQYYKLPWEEVPDLIARRSVFLLSGWAYVPKSDAISFILTTFKRKLEKELNHMAITLPFIENDDRITMLLDSINYEDDFDSLHLLDLSSKTGELLAANIDKTVRFFPPCMLNLHHKLKEEGHLKHSGRMQYGLFLKSIGLKLEEAITFWKKAFSKKISEDSFQKNYLYNIRHNYGQEGKRTNYPPYSCHRIITGPAPSTGDHHGCPFKYQTIDVLSLWLTRNYNVTVEEIKEVLTISASGHYQLACTRLLELINDGKNFTSLLGGTKNSSTIATDMPASSVLTYPHQFYQCCVDSHK